MIRIPYEDKPEMTFDDYEIMIACFKDRKSKRLVKGKSIKTTTKNLKFLFVESLVILFLAFVLYMIFDKPLQGIDLAMVCVYSGFGVLCLIWTFVFPVWVKRELKKAKAKSIKGDTIFDEAGVHVWENPDKGFDQSWDQLTDCYISNDHIFVFFKDSKYVLAMTNKDDMEAKVLAALEMGGKMGSVTRLEVEKGKVREYK